MTYSEKEFLQEARPLAEKLIAYATETGKPYGITDARVNITVWDEHESEIMEGELTKDVSGKKRCEVEIALYAGDRVSSFSRNTLDEKTLTEVMLQNMNAIHCVPGNADQRLLEKEKVYKGPLADLDLYDQNPPDHEALVAYAREIEAAALAQPGIKTTETISISRYNTHYLTRATNGIDFHKSTTSYSVGASVIAEDDQGMQVDGEYCRARHFSDMAAPKEMGEAAAKNALAKLGATLPATGDMPIVLDHAAAATFFSSVFSAISGSAVFKGTTFLKDKIGQQVMSKGVTIVDYPTLPRSMSSGQVDSTGLEMKKVTFVEDGVLKQYLVSLREARQMDVEPTGRQGGLTNTSVLPGTRTTDELMADIGEGIFITGFDGGFVNVNDGIYSRPAHGKLIKDGKVTDKAVEGFIVSGNLKEMFMNVAVANDTPKQPNIRHSFSAPTTRINKAMIAGK